MKEVWRKIEGYEKYSISSIGNVRNDKTGRVLSNGVSGKYHNIQLCKNNIARTYLVHRLVAKAFISNYSENLVINHINLDGLDNRVENLEVCTQAENIRHAVDKNVFTIGSKNGMSKLNEESVREIKLALQKPYLGINKHLSAKYNVKQSTISEIRRGKTWVDV